MSFKKKVTEEKSVELSSETESDSSDDYFEERNEEIQIDFEGRNPTDSDCTGIRQLLKQLFLKSDVNITELADYIIGQNYIGSVVKQCEDDQDDNEDDSNIVFGITTAINLNKSDINCIGQIRRLVDEKAKGNTTLRMYKKIINFLKDPSTTIGFLLNERYVNIPSPIVVPLMMSLMKEVDRANEKKMPFQFTHYMMMLKFYKSHTDLDSKKKSKNSIQSTKNVYANAEEEVFVENAILEFEFAAQHENESHHVADDLIPYRKIIILKAAKLPLMYDSIKKELVN